MENPNTLAYVLISLLFTFTKILTAYMAVDILGGISFETINANPSDFSELKEKLETARLVSYTGVLFTVISFISVYIYTWVAGFKSRVFFFAGILWAIIHMAISPGMAVFVLPVALTLVFQREKHFNPEQFEQPRITAAQRMAKMEEERERSENDSKT